MFRWTIKELETMSDLEIIRGVLSERQTTCTNVYSPLYKKLQQLYNKVDNLIQMEKVKVDSYPSPFDSNNLSQIKIENSQLQDKLHRRNMLIETLKKKLKKHQPIMQHWRETVDKRGLTL